MSRLAPPGVMVWCGKPHRPGRPALVQIEACQATRGSDVGNHPHPEGLELLRSRPRSMTRPSRYTAIARPSVRIVGGRELYFRARHEGWSFDVADHAGNCRRMGIGSRTGSTARRLRRRGSDALQEAMRSSAVACASMDRPHLIWGCSPGPMQSRHAQSECMKLRKCRLSGKTLIQGYSPFYRTDSRRCLSSRSLERPQATADDCINAV